MSGVEAIRQSLGLLSKGALPQDGMDCPCEADPIHERYVRVSKVAVVTWKGMI